MERISNLHTCHMKVAVVKKTPHQWDLNSAVIQESKLLAILLYCPTEIKAADNPMVIFMDDLFLFSKFS